MAIIAHELYKALKDAGVKEVLAESAAKEVAESTNKVLEQKNDITEIKVELKSLREELRTKFNLLMGVNITVLTGIVLLIIGYLFKSLHG